MRSTGLFVAEKITVEMKDQKGSIIHKVREMILGIEILTLTAIEVNYLKPQLFLTIWVIMLILKTAKILDMLITLPHPVM